jgi:sugar transferase (PEP-CTERM system associated)
MIRIFHVYFASRTLLLAVSEALLIVLALIAAMFAVLGADAGVALRYEYELAKLVIAAGVCMLCMHYYDLYDSMILHNPGQAAVRVVQVLGSSCVILACLSYLYPLVQIDQNLLLIWVVLAGLSLIIWRRLFLALNRAPGHEQKTLLLGSGPLASQLASEIKSRPELGLSLQGYLDPDHAAGSRLPQLAYLGGPAELQDLLERRQIQRIIVATENQGGRLLLEPLMAAKSRGVIVDDGPDFYEAVTARVDLNSLRVSMLLFYEGFRFRPLLRLYKRVASVLLSAAGLLLALPVMAAIALAIRLESSGPVIFRQRRVGKDGQPFTLYKFRSMYDGSDQAGHSRPAQVGDRRCTSVGRWLRRSRLDELPQLYNILRGDMHFIGPRPFALDEEENLARQIPFYSNRWAVRPGATGWAQVRRGYNATLEDNVEKLAYDLYYIKHLSVGLDLLILLETIKIVLLGRGGR